MTIRELLDDLYAQDSAAISLLCEIRGLSGRGASGKCEALARSYRGNYPAFFYDLRRQDLVALLAKPTEWEDRVYYLPSATSYPKPELVRIALVAFESDQPPKEFAEFECDCEECAKTTDRRPSSRIGQRGQNEKIEVLVVGNQRYQDRAGWLKLSSPEKDARDFAKLMRELGYPVSLHCDLSLREMKRAIDGFGAGLKRNSGALIYYSGHGAECEDDNWLIPIDCTSRDADDLMRQAISLSSIAKKMTAAAFRVTILDACRDHPFKGIGKGFSAGLTDNFSRIPHDRPNGDLICFASAAKQSALDGRRGTNSLFTAALLRHFRTPGLPIGEVMRAVRREVLHESKNRQNPTNHDALTADWYPAGEGHDD